MEMDTKEVIFLINEEEKIVLNSQDPLDEITCCYDGLISLIQGERKILLSDDDILENMRVLAILLQEALNNSLLLDLSLSDIGFVYNQYCDFLWSEEFLLSVDNFSYEGDKNKDWIGMRYHLWAGGNNVTWLYNDKSGAIILEVTPLYPYLHTDPQEEPKYIFYEKWIKDYRPHFVRTIPRERAQEWLIQAHKIIEQIKINIERRKREQEEEQKIAQS
jgi:hypothetical protein